jgi:ABC-type multidrug transport system fused ATPase/permease subunit
LKSFHQLLPILNLKIPSQAILLDEINLASPPLLEVLEVFMLNMGSQDAFILPNGKSIQHRPIVIVATMNSAALSNARSALSTKIQAASHFLRLVPFSKIEHEVLTDSILSDSESLFGSTVSISKIIRAHMTAAELLEKDSGLAAERDTITLREFLRFKHFHQSCPTFTFDQLIELVYTTPFCPETTEKLLSKNIIQSLAEDRLSLIRSGLLVLADNVKLPLPLGSKSNPLDLPFTSEQRRAACLVGAGIMARKTVALFGESGSGKTHLIRTFAQVVGVTREVVQFNIDWCSGN